MEFKVITYIVYIVISLILTFWVGGTLHKYGRTFLLDIFKQNELLTDSINKLLLIGFYLLNFGYILYALYSHRVIESTTQMIELLSTKIGGIVIVLGVIHIFNILVLLRVRRKATQPRSQIVNYNKIPVTE